ncbi:MAG: caspase family protein [Acidovorax sp.]
MVGISRYKDRERYPPLDGPLNDVDRMVTWLRDLEGVGITDPNRIIRLRTPDELLGEPPTGGWPEGTSWHPTRNHFSDAFDRITLDGNGEFIRRDARLYLYLSGHGFSQSTDQVPSAALYGADNYGKKVGNLAGTLYAQAAKNAKLFKEVVLIMDCCRDAETNVAYSPPDLNKVENDGSESVQMMAIYAAPKRGKAQERELIEPDGTKVVGLLTAGWLRALREAPCDVIGRVPGQLLKQYISNNWQKWYPNQTPPMPRFIVPETGDIYFASGKALLDQPFVIGAGASEDIQYRLISTTLNAVGMVSGQIILWQDQYSSWESVVPLATMEDGSKTFTLRLCAEEHRLSNGMNGQGTPFTPGGAGAVNC